MAKNDVKKVFLLCLEEADDAIPVMTFWQFLKRDRLHGVFSDHPDRLKTSNVLAVYTATVL
ncbi:hypothetical protein [Coleofasciculus sp. FACHB-SPT9]|uniref:hypothetical protein n=1 Tax=Cyanophyceae TaxID=3028117 RepID=UPI001688EEFD|nr:hypothetical protein [Coleofasciculus sp. FACHB-SPT9]MBD1891210.1 hypothetical protein [Coleofasciculus sp. FACHB-SPT9]